MYSALVYANEESTLIRATRDDGTQIIIEPSNSDLWALATSGALGSVAAYTPPPRSDISQEVAIVMAVRMLDQFALQFINDYAGVERLSWPAKETAARAYLADLPALLTIGPNDKNMVETEALEAGVTAEALANRIVARADTFRDIVAHVSGWRDAARQDIEAATDSDGRYAALDALQAKIDGFSV